MEENGDYTREIGYLKFANYTVNVSSSSSYDNLLNNVWYQPEEVFPVDGTPEEREHAFWVPVDSLYFQLSQNLLVRSFLPHKTRELSFFYLSYVWFSGFGAGGVCELNHMFD